MQAPPPDPTVDLVRALPPLRLALQRALPWTCAAILALVLDPRLESADIDRSDNVWPREAIETRVRLRESTPGVGGQNPMQAAEDEASRLRQRVPRGSIEEG